MILKTIVQNLFEIFIFKKISEYKSFLCLKPATFIKISYFKSDEPFNRFLEEKNNKLTKSTKLVFTSST